MDIRIKVYDYVTENKEAIVESIPLTFTSKLKVSNDLTSDVIIKKIKYDLYKQLDAALIELESEIEFPEDENKYKYLPKSVVDFFEDKIKPKLCTKYFDWFWADLDCVCCASWRGFIFGATLSAIIGAFL